MSWQATAWVSTVEAGGPSGKLLLYALANYADENGRCWPSDARLMADTEMAERTIRDWKRKLEEAGLVKVERRRTGGGTFQADEIRLAMAPVTAKRPPANAAGGDAVTTGISPQDHRHLTTAPPASDDIAYIEEPSEEPSVEPREGGAGDRVCEESQPETPSRDDPKKFEMRVKRLGELGWPNWSNSSTGWTVRQFAALSDAERAEAERLAPAYLAHCGRKALSPGTYFHERKWRDLPAAVVARIDAPAVLMAQPFGKLFGAIRLWRLSQPHGVLPRAPAFLAGLMAEPGEKGERERRAYRALHGWPSVRAMHVAAERGAAVTVAESERWLDVLAEGFEPVKVGSERFEAWKVLHEQKGWPWLPDPGRVEWVYFPAGGPEGLRAFEAAMRGESDYHGRSEAAE